MRLARPLVLALLAIMLSPAAARADDAPVSDQIIVRHKAGLDAAERLDIRNDSDTVLERRMHLDDAEVVAVAEGTRAEALTELRTDPDVVWAEPNGIVHAQTNDTFWSLMWALYNGGLSGARIDADLDAQQAWSVSEGTGVTVAVVDTGVQASHPDLAGRLVAGYDYVNGDSDPADGHGHGTHVAGIIAADRDNGVGVVGVAPQAKVMPLKALADDGSGYFDDIADAFDDAGAAGVPVVNASLGDDSPSSLAIKTAIAAHPNTLYVVAAGNSSQNVDVTPWTPCDAPYSNVLCVGASDDTDARADFSNYGMNGVDLFAPGVDIASTVPSGYAYKSGTSMATPYTAGVAALVASVTSLRGAALAQRLKDTVDHPTALAGLSVTGGRLNAARAVGAAVDGPSQAVIAGAQGGTTSATITMASRESDIGSYLVYDGGVYVGTSGARVFTINGLAAGSHTFTVVARNTSGMDSAVSAPATVTVQAAPTPAPATPVQERPGTAGLPTTTTPTVTPSSVSGVQIVRRGGRRSLLFRVTGTARITVTLLKLQGGRYRRTSSKTVRMAAGLQSLPITSRLLGMRVPRGRSQVTVGTGAAVATVAFTRR